MSLTKDFPPNPPAAYRLNNSQHVVYRGSDDHIHELYSGDGPWEHNDLSVASGAFKLAGTSASGSPAGYTLGDWQHVIYRGSDDHIHELYAVGGPWGHNDLTDASGIGRLSGALAIGRPAGYALGGSQHVVYRGGDDHIHELYSQSGSWGHNDLTIASGAIKISGAAALGDPAGYTFNNSQHVVYRGSDGHIHELYWEGEAWGHNDLSVATGASKISGASAVGDPAGYSLTKSQHVVYRGSDGHVHELHWDDGPWGHNDLTVASGASKISGATAAGDPAGYRLNNSQHVVYRGSDGHIYELYWEGEAWGHNDLSVASGASKISCASAVGDPAGYILNNSQHVVYRGSNGDIHELYWTGGPWDHHDLTVAASAIKNPAGPPINPEVFNEYDMVVCITEKVINQQLARLVSLGVIEPKLILAREIDEHDNYVYRQLKSSDEIPKDPKGNPSVACLDAEILPQIRISQSGQKVTLVLSFQSGTANLSILDSPRFQKYDVTGWEYGISITLDLKTIEKDDIGKKINVPALVADQLSHFLNSDFEISHLFLDFDSVDLLTFDPIITKAGDAGSDGTKQLAAFMQFYLRGQQRQGNPFILGYSVNASPRTRIPGDQNVPSTLRPSGTTFTLYNDPQYPALSNLNFVLVTEGGHRQISGAPGNLKNNWIRPEDASDGKIIFSHASLFEPLLLQPLFDRIRTDVWQRVKSQISVPQGNSYTSAKQVRSDRWDFNISNITRGDNQYVNSFSVAIDNENDSIEFYFRGQVYAYKEESKDYVVCTATAHAAGTVYWSGIVTVRAVRNAHGSDVIKLDNAFQIDGLSTTSGKNDCADKFDWIGSILGAIIDSFTAFRDGGFFINLFSDLFGLDIPGIGNLGVALENVSADVKNIILLPAGEVFDFKNGSSDYEGNISFQLTYKNGETLAFRR